jgi:hypothetical protein
VLGVGVVVPILGVVTVGLETRLLETGVLAACGVACGAEVGLELPLATGGVAVGGVTVTGLTGGLLTVFGAATLTGFKPKDVL